MGFPHIENNSFGVFESDHAAEAYEQMTSGRGIWPGNPAFQILSSNSGDACWRITFTTFGVATAFAFGIHPSSAAGCL
jgi:hypothetical protein